MGSTEDLETEVGHTVGHSRNFTLSPETTDCDSNCDSEGSSLLLADVNASNVPTTATLPPPRSMPVLEDGLSSGHASDTENNNPTVSIHFELSCLLQNLRRVFLAPWLCFSN